MESTLQCIDEFHLPRGYKDLLALLYRDQQGTLLSGDRFDIQRGVKQGDVLSPLLFNAALDVALRRWTAQLQTQGIELNSAEFLTHVCFADDLIVYARSAKDLIYMVDALTAELARVGLVINEKKCKYLRFSGLAAKPPGDA